MSLRTIFFLRCLTGLLMLVVSIASVLGRRVVYLDVLTGAGRMEYQFGPICWRKAERPGSGSAWAASRLPDPTRRHWVFACSEPMGLAVGPFACGFPFDAVYCLSQADLPSSTRDELLGAWQSGILDAPTEFDFHAFARRFRAEHAELLGIQY